MSSEKYLLQLCYSFLIDFDFNTKLDFYIFIDYLLCA